MRKLLVCTCCACAVACASFAEADSCIVSGSTVSAPVAESCAVGGLDSGGVAVCTSAEALEARFCTWLGSLGIGIDPTLMPGFFYIIR